MTRIEPDPTYRLSRADAALLLGALNMKADERAETLRRLLPPEDAARILAEFIGLAASVHENVRGFAEAMIVCEANVDPNFVEKWNFPDLMGALLGVGLSEMVSPSPDMCGGCAFRRGAHANQCVSTITDAQWTLHPGEQPFMCHEHLEDEQPTRACGGWKQARRSRAGEARP